MTTSASLIDAVSARVSPAVITTISMDVDASPLQTSGAVKRAIPATLAGIMDAASTEAGAARVLRTAIEENDSGVLERVGHMGDEEIRTLGAHGIRMLGFVFGDRAMEAIDAVARAAFTSREVSLRVLGTIAPITLAIIGRESINRRLGPPGLQRYLGEQRPIVLASPELPHDAALGNIVSGFGTVETPVLERAPKRKSAAAGLGWVFAIVGLLALLVGAIGALGGTRRERESSESSTTTTTGATLETPDRANFSSYTLVFQRGSTQLSADGEQSLKGIADAMTANPNERIQLTGHTDSISEKRFGRDLASKRAAVIKKKLVERGVEPSRIEVSAREGQPNSRRVDVTRIGP